MPAKPSKDFVAYNLSRLLKNLSQQQEEETSLLEGVKPPPSKRQKLSPDDLRLEKMAEISLLSKKGSLLIGLNKVQKALTNAASPTGGSQALVEQYVVFILNDQETIDMNKHIVGFCRQFGFHNFLLPKFLK